MEDDDMKKVRTWLALVTGVVTLLFSLNTPAMRQSEAAGPSIRTFEPREALALIEKNKGNADFVILDVRMADEFADGHVEGAVNVDYNAGDFRYNLTQLDKKKTYLVYCRTGRRSGAAVKVMTEMGFTNIYRMSGDMVKWQSMKLPVVK
jgi:rhodanese-related sulfurtransferase